MSISIDQLYPQVRSDWQIHLWEHPSRHNGCIVDSRTGVTKPISFELAKLLRRMDGSERVGEIADQSLAGADPRGALRDMSEHLQAEKIITLTPASPPKRHFAKPVPHKSILTIMQLQLTNQCNLLCDHCYADSHSKGHKGFSTAIIRDLIDEFVGLGGVRLFLTGGEIMMRPDLEDIVAHAKSRCLFVYLNTNGYSLTAERAERLVRLGVGAVNVSLDGSDAATHDAFRRKKGSFDKVLNALDAFTALGIPCATQTTLHKGNLDQGRAIHELAKLRGAANTYFVPMIPQGRAQRFADQIPAWNETFSAMKEIELAKYVPSETVCDNPVDGPSGPGMRCTAGTAQLYMRADGACFPCTSLEFDDFRLGAYPDESLEDIWAKSSGPARELRDFNHTSIESCGGCKRQSSCKSGCAGNAFSLRGDWRKSDPYGCLKRDVDNEVEGIMSRRADPSLELAGAPVALDMPPT